MISVIIPTFNEAAHICKTIELLRQFDKDNLIKQIIISDGGSTDDTVALAKSTGVKTMSCPKKGRAVQMNAGASYASEQIFYFLHADTFPPENFTKDIAQAVERGFGAGCFRLSFDHPHWFLKAHSWFTRFDINALRYGDQSLFVTRDAFENAGGFSEKHMVMEDQQFIKRVKKIVRFTIIKKPVLTSARKYLDNGIFKTQGIFYMLYFMYRFGCSQQKLLTTYRNLLRQDKL